MKIAVRRLMEHMLCPRSIRLWESDPMRKTFQIRFAKFLSATKAFIESGWGTAVQILDQAIREAPTPQAAGLYRQSKKSLENFRRFVADNRLRFRKKGLRVEANLGSYTLSLPVRLVEELDDGTCAAWVFFDFVEVGLNRGQFALAERVTRWVIASSHPEFSQVVFYVPRTGEVRRSPIGAKDAAWNPDVLLPAIRLALSDKILPKKPGPQCSRCWHFRQGRCDADQATQTEASGHD